MTPLDPRAGLGPIHATAAFLRDRLALVFPPAKRFQHELLPAPLTAATLGLLADVSAPFVGLAFIGADMRATAGRRADLKLSWGVYLLAKNPGRAGRLLGDAQGVGLAQMVHALVLGLHGWTVGGASDGGAGTLALTKGEAMDGALWGRRDIACWAHTLEVDGTFPAPAEDSLQLLAASWDFNGFADAASDNIPLEGA